jgi:chromosomal replication initiation ATPase DnaA
MTHAATFTHPKDPPSALVAQYRARQARLQRFEDAATRHRKAKQAVVLEKIAAAQAREEAKRREYDVESRQSVWMPIARRILLAVSREFGMPVERIVAKSNEAKYCLPRFVAIGLMLEATNLSLPAIGKWLGGRDHSTVINGRRRIEALLESESFRNRFDQIKAGVLA